MTCKRACRWGVPAKIFDGPTLHEASAIRTAIKRAPKNSPEAARLQALLTGQARLCWTCGRRCSEEEADRLVREARFIDAQLR